MYINEELETNIDNDDINPGRSEVHTARYLNEDLETLFQCCQSSNMTNLEKFGNFDPNYLKVLVNFKVRGKCLFVEAALNGNFQMIQWLHEKG